MLELPCLVKDLADAFVRVDQKAPTQPGKKFKAGIGPLTEAFAVQLAFDDLLDTNPQRYPQPKPCRYEGSRSTCDIVSQPWAIELKLARPFGDNGRAAENWIENLLYPYPGNVSAVGDLYKLSKSTLAPKKAVIVFGFEHSQSQIALEPAVRSFELIATQVAGFRLSERVSESRGNLIHPVHQVLRIYGWELYN